MTKIILLILIFASSCDDPIVEGCTSPSACNWNPEANKSNGTCIQPQFCDNWCPENLEDTPPEAGDSYEWNEQGRDCEGTCRGQALIDDCGICISPYGENDDILPQESPLWNTTCVDCEGIPNGTSSPDCNGDCGGSAVVDECGICNGDGYIAICEGSDNCSDMDCYGTCNGFAIIDDCGACTDGETGLVANFKKDECGICDGDGYANGPLNNGIDACIGNDTCVNMDCAGICNPNIITQDYIDYTESQFCETNYGSGYGWKPYPGCTELETIDGSSACINDDLTDICYLYGAQLDNCLECSGGNTNNIACTQDCDDIWGGVTELDCFGVCGGSAIEDECGTCNGSGAIYDCKNWGEGNNICHDGINGGDTPICFADIETQCYAPDECGDCDGDGPVDEEGVPNPNYNCDGACIAECDEGLEDCNLGLWHGPGKDCAGICGGSAVEDECGLCNGNNYANGPLDDGVNACYNPFGSSKIECSLMDCTATCKGTATLDCLGFCNGGAVNDCTGECGGDAQYDPNFGTDECTEANGYIACNNNPNDDCLQDCAGVWGGTASLDNCGACTGGNTGFDPNEGPTPDGEYSCSDMSLLITIDVCDDIDDCEIQTCPTLLWGFKDDNGIVIKDDDGNVLNKEDCELEVEGYDCEYQELYGFDFTGCGIQEIPDYVANTNFSITTLNLSNNQIGQSTFGSFPGILLQIPTLTELDLELNMISELPDNICDLLNQCHANNDCINITLTNNLMNNQDCIDANNDCTGAGILTCE